MKARRWRWSVLLMAVALVAVGCGDDDDEPAQTTGTTAVPAPTFEPGTTMANIQAKGKIVVGVKFDQPGFGQKNPTTGQVEGFDVEIAKLIAAGIFGGTAESVTPKVEFVEAVSRNREPFIQNGNVDIVVATYTISNARKQVVDFAGPYFVARQDIMVKSNDNSIKSVTDLNGKKVCTVKGSTSETNVRAQAPRAEVVLFDTYSQCAEALTDGRVAAETTDNTILAGLVQQSNGAFKLVNNPFSDEPYGIGLKKGDEPFRNFLNDQIEKIEGNGDWAKAFEATLGKLGLPTPTPPQVDRYAPGAAATSTTASSGATSTTARSGATTTTVSSGTTSTTGR